MAITLSDPNQFSNFFHYWKELSYQQNHVIFPTLPLLILPHYLVKLKVLCSQFVVLNSSSGSEEVILSVITVKCLPVLLYGFDVCLVNTNDINTMYFTLATVTLLINVRNYFSFPPVCRLLVIASHKILFVNKAVDNCICAGSGCCTTSMHELNELFAELSNQFACFTGYSLLFYVLSIYWMNTSPTSYTMECTLNKQIQLCWTSHVGRFAPFWDINVIIFSIKKTFLTSFLKPFFDWCSTGMLPERYQLGSRYCMFCV